MPRTIASSLIMALSAITAHAGDSSPPPSYANTTLTGDWMGYRNWLRDNGVTLTLTQTSDVLGNTSGGLRTGSAYDGVFQLQGDFDMDRLMGWSGGTIHVSAYAIQGLGLSRRDLGNLLTVTSVEAASGVRLGEVYVAQSLVGGAVTLKLGQILADQSFAISNTAGLFVNSTFGWPGLFASDLPGGGPAYPFAVPGAQIIVKPDDAWTIQAAIFNGNPTGPDPNGNHNGLGFPIGDGVLAIGEVAYAYQPTAAIGLPGTYKLGVWYNSEQFDSLSEASNGVSLADPLSSGVPQLLSGNYAIYAVIDQTLWQERGNDDNGLNGFARVAFAPQQDRNLISWYFDAGLSYKGLLPGRENDMVGIGFAYANISNAASSLARAGNAFSSSSQPIQTSEAVIELTYQAAMTNGLTVQPFFQYVIRPGGNAPDPERPESPLGNAPVFGLRAAGTF